MKKRSNREDPKYDELKLNLFTSPKQGDSGSSDHGIAWFGASGYPQPGQLYFGAAKSDQPSAGPTVPDIGFFGGQMDEIMIYNVALSGPQLQAIYNAGSAGLCPCP